MQVFKHLLIIFFHFLSSVIFREADHSISWVDAFKERDRAEEVLFSYCGSVLFLVMELRCENKLSPRYSSLLINCFATNLPLKK